MESLQNIKRRIRGAESISQITKAMELVAATKMLTDTKEVPTKKRVPTMRREFMIRAIWTCSESLALACLSKKLSSISRRRWNKIKAQVVVMT